MAKEEAAQRHVRKLTEPFCLATPSAHSEAAVLESNAYVVLPPSYWCGRGGSSERA